MNLAKMRAQSVRTIVPGHRSSRQNDQARGEGLMHRLNRPGHHTYCFVDDDGNASLHCADCGWRFPSEQR